MPPALRPPLPRESGSWLSDNYGHPRRNRPSGIRCPGTPLTRHIDDDLADLANANKPQNTIRAYRGDLIGFAGPCDGDMAGAPAAPVRAFLGEIAGRTPSIRNSKPASFASFCKWAIFSSDPAGAGTAMIASGTVPAPLPAHIGVSQNSKITAQWGLCRHPG